MPVVVLLVLATLCLPLLAQSQDDSLSLDLSIFSQADDIKRPNEGGNPILNEEFLYAGVRAAARFRISKVVSLRPTVGISSIDPGRKVSAPETVTNATDKNTNATTTSASATNITMALVTDVKPNGSGWTLSPGAFFAYQPTYVSRGLDFGAGVELFGGDTVVSMSYGVRWDSITGGNLRVSGIFGGGLPNEISEYGHDRRLHNRFAHNFELGLTQNLSAEWRVNTSIQYTRQDGWLSHPNAKVTLFDARTPVKFVNERLPNWRDRFQLNLRVRYSPALHFALGMDHSAYWDDWSVANFALEPNFEGTFGHEAARWRFWYRIAYQQGARFFRSHPQREYRWQTHDPDLATFNTHTAGLLLWFDMPETGDLQWILRLSAYGLYRSDHIWGVGALIGSEFAW